MFSFHPHSSLLLVYEGKDDESERIEALINHHYDADISNCSTDLNTSHDDSHNQCSSNDENDGGIGHEDESNMEHCQYESSDEQVDKNHLLPKNRAVSPHSMDSWLNYSNSSDEFTGPDSKLNLHDDEATHDADDVDVYDKINFVNSIKKSKIDEASCDDTANDSNPFKFPAVDVNVSKHDTDDGIEVELEEEEDDDQLSSLSSNIDTIIVSDTGETKFFNSAGEQEEHPSSKKKKSTTSEDKIQLTNGTKPLAPLVDVRIIDFAHTTFSSSDPVETSSKKVHHGPDGGFLTGVESLKRILSEIISESN